MEMTPLTWEKTEVWQLPEKNGDEIDLKLSECQNDGIYDMDRYRYIYI
jgi:hypothetical protein